MKVDKHNLHRENITYKYPEMLDTIYAQHKISIYQEYIKIIK